MREEMYKINAEMRNVATVESHDDDGKIKLISIRLYDIALMWHRQFMRIVGENVTYSMVELPEEQSMSFFITGLQSDIKLAVRMFKPKSLAKLYGLCKVQESQLNVTKQRGKIPLLATPMYTYSSPNVINSPKLLALSAPKANWRNKPSTSASNTYRKHGQVFLFEVIVETEEQENTNVELEESSDEKIKGPMTDQPLSVDASPTALSPGYIADSDPKKDKEDPEKDPADHPADG
ncbi:hypothetical protein Tco_1361795 [Tanacetum coccineum]